MYDTVNLKKVSKAHFERAKKKEIKKIVMLDDSVLLILMVSDTVTMRFRLLHACVCFNQAPGKRRNYFYSTLSQLIGANLFVFFHLFVLLWFAMFCKEYLCMKKTKKTLLTCRRFVGTT